MCFLSAEDVPQVSQRAEEVKAACELSYALMHMIM